MKQLLFLIAAAFVNLSMSPLYLNEAQTARYNAEFEKIYQERFLELKLSLSKLSDDVLHEIVAFGADTEEVFKAFIEHELKEIAPIDNIQRVRTRLEHYSGLCFSAINGVCVIQTETGPVHKMKIHMLTNVIKRECYNEKFAQILCVALDAFTKAIHDRNLVINRFTTGYQFQKLLFRTQQNENKKIQIIYDGMNVIEIVKDTSEDFPPSFYVAFDQAAQYIKEILDEPVTERASDVVSQDPISQLRNTFFAYLNTLRNCFSCLNP